MTIQCTRCVLSEFQPDVQLNADGLCNFCADDQQQQKQTGRARPLLESDLSKILDKYRGKGKYDCLMMCSGGKDSTAALYYIKRRHRMTPLAFTFDHGFENPGAVDNVRRATSELGVDMMIYRSEEMHELFAEIIRSRAPVPICPICSLWYMQLTHQIAKQFGVRLIVSGYTRGQISEGGSSNAKASSFRDCGDFDSMSRATAAFLKGIKKSNPRYRDFPLTMKEALRKFSKMRIVSPHWFMSDDPEEYTALIRRELGWRAVCSST